MYPASKHLATSCIGYTVGSLNLVSIFGTSFGDTYTLGVVPAAVGKPRIDIYGAHTCTSVHHTVVIVLHLGPLLDGRGRLPVIGFLLDLLSLILCPTSSILGSSLYGVSLPLDALGLLP